MRLVYQRLQFQIPQHNSDEKIRKARRQQRAYILEEVVSPTCEEQQKETSTSNDRKLHCSFPWREDDPPKVLQLIASNENSHSHLERNGSADNSILLFLFPFAKVVVLDSMNAVT